MQIEVQKEIENQSDEREQRRRKNAIYKVC